MKRIALILLALLLAAVAGLGWLYFTAQVSLVDVRAVAVPADRDMALFERLRAQAEADAQTGTVFEPGPLGEAADYCLITYTVTLNNATMVDFDLAEVQITPMEGDLLQLGTDTLSTIPARSMGTLTATLLAPAGSHTVRELIITGYMWGQPQRIRAYTR